MSSDGFHYLTSDGLAMLEHVLAQANFPRSAGTSKAEARSDATHLFIARSQGGEPSKMGLRETLCELSVVDDYPPEAEGYDIAVSIAAADMTTPSPAVQRGHGKRIQADTSRAISRVFTGAPVSIGARDLFDTKTALRALRILNTPDVDEPNDE